MTTICTSPSCTSEPYERAVLDFDYNHKNHYTPKHSRCKVCAFQPQVNIGWPLRFVKTRRDGQGFDHAGDAHSSPRSCTWSRSSSEASSAPTTATPRRP